MQKTFDEIVDTSPMCVFAQRYGGGYIAFLAKEELLNEIVYQHTAGDEDWAAIYFGVFATDWYPCGEGRTVDRAIEKLRGRVMHYLKHDRAAEWLRAWGWLENEMFLDDKNRSYNYKLRGEAIKAFMEFDKFTLEELEEFLEK